MFRVLLYDYKTITVISQSVIFFDKSIEECYSLVNRVLLCNIKKIGGFKMSKKNVATALRVMIGLVGITLMFNGFMWGFFPNNNLETYDIIVNASSGMNMIKSDIGGPLLIAGLFTLLYSIKGEKWYWSTLLISSGYLFVRFFSIIFDGYSQTAMLGIVVEIIAISLLIVSYKVNKLLT